MDGQTPEHYLEVLFNARANAALQEDEARRAIWLQVERNIQTIFADHLSDVAEARDRLAARSDDEGRAMFAYLDALVRSYDDADRAAREVIERARST